jgi:HEAT repeat protein
MRGGKYSEGDAIHALPGMLPSAPPSAKLVVDHVADIAAGLGDALSEHRDVVVSVLSDLDAAPDRLALGALTPATGDGKVQAAVQQIAAAIEPKITAQLASDDPKVRALAVSVLAKLDSGKPQGAEAAITKALGDSSELVRAAAMQSIPVLAHRRGGAPKTLVAHLMTQLAAPAWGDRREAALALGKLGPGTDTGALVKAAHDSSSFVREAVATALGQIGGPQVTATLQQLAGDEVPQVKEAAQRGLARLGPP